MDWYISRDRALMVLLALVWPVTESATKVSAPVTVPHRHLLASCTRCAWWTVLVLLDCTNLISPTTQLGIRRSLRCAAVQHLLVPDSKGQRTDGSALWFASSRVRQARDMDWCTSRDTAGRYRQPTTPLSPLAVGVVKRACGHSYAESLWRRRRGASRGEASSTGRGAAVGSSMACS